MSINQVNNYFKFCLNTYNNIIEALTPQPADTTTQRYSTLNLNLLGDDDCASRILAFSGRPSNAEVCKHWYKISRNSYFLIKQDYLQDAKIRQFMPLVAANSLQAVQQTYHTVMNSTKFSDRTRLIKNYTVMNTTKKVSDRNRLIEKSPLKALCQTSPLDLRPIVKVVEDANLVQFFMKSAWWCIPANEMPALGNELNLAQRANVIRTWMMKDHQQIADHMITLNLSDLDLTTLPKEIGQLVNLQRLDLNNNQLATLPEEIGQLVNLQRLNLNNNQLATLPKEIGQLVNLQELDLNNNQLATLPKEIGQLVNLQRLNLNNNQLATLPKEIGQLMNLQCLCICYNQPATLPEEIGQLVNLQFLRVYNNQPLPKELWQLVNLHVFDVFGNPVPLR